MDERVLVCGGREFSDRRRLFTRLDRLAEVRGVALVIHGAAKGADTLARDWAKERGIGAKPFPAKWDEHGKAAGPIRNQQMLDEGKPTMVVAFPGGSGTRDMITRAKRHGVPVVYG